LKETNLMKSLQLILNDKLLVEKISDELQKLEKNPIHGWDKIYVNLYTTLNSIIEELSVKINCPAPYLFIDFNGINKYQAATHIMTDKTTQLHIGIEFIRKYLLCKEPENIKIKHSCFIWIIAHELGHLADPKMHLFARSYKIRIIMNRAISICISVGAINVIFPGSIGLSNTYLLPLGTSLFVFNKLATALLHRSFEYTADKNSLRCFDNFDPKISKTVLTEITSTIKKDIEKNASHNSSFIGNLKKIFIQLKTFALHPSVDRRINRLVYFIKSNFQQPF
jgi:hypothetical protein